MHKSYPFEFIESEAMRFYVVSESNSFFLSLSLSLSLSLCTYDRGQRFSAVNPLNQTLVKVKKGWGENVNQYSVYPNRNTFIVFCYLPGS